MNRSERMLMRRNIVGQGIVFAAVAALVLSAPAESQTGGTASDGPGNPAAWTTGNKLAVGTSADPTSTVWFTVAKGITSEVFYPRLDIPNMQDMQYIITDGATFVDLERDATNHVVSMPDEKALEYTVTNTDKRATPKYRITNTYITDPSQNTLLIRTRFQSLDGGAYQLYLLENASMAGGGANNNAWWDPTNSALMSSGTATLGSTMTVVSALKWQTRTASSRTITATPAAPATAQLHGTADDAERRHLLSPLRARQLRREQHRLQRLSCQRSQSLRTAVAGSFRRTRRVRARKRPRG